MEKSFVHDKVLAAREQVLIAEGQLDAAIAANPEGSLNAPSLDGASRSLHAAQASLDEMSTQMETEAAAEPALRDCPVCGNRIRAAASLCGHCWTRFHEPYT